MFEQTYLVRGSLLTVSLLNYRASEEKDYPFDHPPQTFAEFANNGKAIGHYTQVRHVFLIFP